MKRNALMFFSTFSSLECVIRILEHLEPGKRDAYINKQTSEGCTALHFACRWNNEAIVKKLLDEGADPNKINTPLGHVTKRKHGSDRIKIPGTPLCVAIHHHAVQCAYLLLESPKLNFKFNDQDDKEKYILLLKEAVNLDEPKIVLKVLEKHDRTYTMKTNHLLHCIVKSEAYSDEEFTKAVRLLGKNCIEASDEEERTPIMLAAMLNKHRKLRILQKTYLRILEENLFYREDSNFQSIYKDFIGKQDKNHDRAVHLAVKHDGLDADFEYTIKVLNELRTDETMKIAISDEKARDPLILRDGKERTGIHVALECGKAERAIMLLRVSKSQGADLRDYSTPPTIIHYAIENKISAVQFEKLLVGLKEFLLGHELGEIQSELLTMLKAKYHAHEGKTALQMALKSKLSKHAELMIDFNQDLLDGHAGSDHLVNVSDDGNKNALQIAIENGCPSDLITKLMNCESKVHRDNKSHGYVPIDKDSQLSNVKAVLDNKRGELTSTRDVANDHGVNLLTAAIEAKRPDIIKYLLVREAKVSHTHFKQVILDDENKEFAMLLVRYADKAEDLIQELTDTFFHKLIEKMPDVAEEALNRCTELVETKSKAKTAENVNQENGSSTQKSSSSAEIPLEVRITSDGHSQKDDSSSSSKGNDSHSQKDDSSSSSKGNDSHSQKDDSSSSSSPLKVMVSASLSQEDDSSNSSSAETALEVMVKHEKLTLLQHPVVHNFIKLKWEDFGLPLYIFELMLYCFFIIPLSILVLFLESSVEASDRLYALATLVILAAIIHVAILAILSTSACILVCHMRENGMKIKDFFLPITKRADLYLQIGVFLLAFVFSILTIICSSTECTDWQWHLGLFAVALGWMNFIRLYSKFPFVGQYAIIFATIVWTFLKLALFALLLILPFTIVLIMVFFDAQALRSPFFNFRRGFVTVLTMVTGDLGYQDAFGLSYNDTDVTTNIEYPGMANFVWVIFLVLMPILLTNMLTGLAVGDIMEIQSHAELTKLEQKVKLITRVEHYDVCKKCCIAACLKWRCCTGIRKALIGFINLLIWLWNGENETKSCGDDTSYSKKREEEIKEIKLSGGDSKQDTIRIVEGIDDVKNIALSCEKNIREFKDVYDDTINKLKNENAKIRRDNKQLMSEVRKLQQPTASGGSRGVSKVSIETPFY